MEKEARFWQNKYFFHISAAAVLANIFSWIIILFFLKKGVLNIILHYDILSGVDYKGDWQKLFTIPEIGLAIFFMNFAIIRAVRAKDEFIAYLLLSTSLISQVFVIIAVAAIILINNKNSY